MSSAPNALAQPGNGNRSKRGVRVGVLAAPPGVEGGDVADDPGREGGESVGCARRADVGDVDRVGGGRVGSGRQRTSVVPHHGIGVEACAGAAAERDEGRQRREPELHARNGTRRR